MSVTRRDQDRPDRDSITVARDHDPEASDVPICHNPACGEYRNPEKSVRGSYCSAECYFRHRGHKALKNLEKDHRFCRTCFGRVKEIEDPPEGLDVPEFVVGYQYGTPRATTAAREYDRDGLPPLIRQRLGCRCGATDLRKFDPALATVDPEETIGNLVVALREKYREDKLPLVDHHRLAEAYDPDDPASLEYAVGVALYE